MHYAKTPAGAVLDFYPVRHPESLFERFEAFLASTTDLCAKDRARARAILDTTQDWVRFPVDIGNPAPSRGLIVALTAKPNTDVSVRVAYGLPLTG